MDDGPTTRAFNATIHRDLCSAGVLFTLKAEGVLQDDGGGEPDALALVLVYGLEPDD